MTFKTLIQKMTQAAVRGDGLGVAACFCENGIYHDVFYGEFRGSAIINLIEGIQVGYGYRIWANIFCLIVFLVNIDMRFVKP